MTLINPYPAHTIDQPLEQSVRAARGLVRRITHRGLMLLVYVITVAMSIGSSARAQQPPPDFITVSQLVQQHFSTFADYQAGDVISRSHVDAVMDGLRDIGWEVPNRAAITQLVLPDNSFLISEFSTPAGKKFMRRLANQSGAYSRLDRLTSIARGKTIVRDLIRGKDGAKLIEYLATTKSGRNLGRMLGSAKAGVDLNKPTGRIYTADDLLAVLEAEHAKAFP